MSKKALFPSLPEFALIQGLLNAADGVALPQPPTQRRWLGPGDDCAQFDGWLATLDMSVEGTHFRMDWSSPEQIVQKCLLSNFSDINAMGGVSRLAFLGLCFNRKWPQELKTRVAQAFADGCRSQGVQIMGGDTVTGETACFSVTVLGTSDHAPLVRSAARPGQDIYVAGVLGDSAAGLWLFQNESPLKNTWALELMRAHQVPNPPLTVGPVLAALPGIGACMDLSDGLSSELHHLALQSQVCLRIEQSAIPLSAALTSFCHHFEMDSMPFWLNGGEDYGLLFTCDSKERVILQSLIQGGVLHRIGTVLPGQGVELLTVNGNLVSIPAAAWSHL